MIPQCVAVRLLLPFHSTELIVFIISVIYSIELHGTEFEQKATALVQGFIQDSDDKKLSYFSRLAIIGQQPLNCFAIYNSNTQ